MPPKKINNPYAKKRKEREEENAVTELSDELKIELIKRNQDEHWKWLNEELPSGRIEVFFPCQHTESGFGNIEVPSACKGFQEKWQLIESRAAKYLIDMFDEGEHVGGTSGADGFYINKGIRINFDIKKGYPRPMMNVWTDDTKTKKVRVKNFKLITSKAQAMALTLDGYYYLVDETGKLYRITVRGMVNMCKKYGWKKLARSDY